MYDMIGVMILLVVMVVMVMMREEEKERQRRKGRKEQAAARNWLQEAGNVGGGTMGVPGVLPPGCVLLSH